MKTILVDAINAFVIKEHGIFEKMHQLLESYPNSKIILTSANDEQMKMFGLDHMPYEVFTLKHDPEKADPAYYQAMLQHFSLSPEQVVYFEHKQEAVKSAASVGIHTYYYNPDTKDLVGLKKFLNESLGV